MQRPLIGLTCEIKPPDRWRRFSTRKEIFILNREYVSAVEQAGGFPLLIPILESRDSLERLMGTLQGLILTGGDDVVTPGITWTGNPVCQKRSQHETAVLEMARANQLPVLGICRGLQQINVFFGGTLWSDLPAWKEGVIDHRRGKRAGKFRHRITLPSNTELGAVLGCQPQEVNSSHHQGVKDLGSGLRLVAQAEDGVIEAYEAHEGALLWAVQWHPERLGESPAGDHLMRNFVDCCRNHR